MAARSADDTAIVYDSTADLPDGPASHPNWAMVPLTVHFGTDAYRDYVDLDIGEFYRRLAASPVPPTTSQPTPAAFAAVYDQLLERYGHLYSLHISGLLSGTVESARLAAAEWPGRITVVDTGAVSALIALAVIGLQSMLERGTDDDEMAAHLEQHRRDARCFFSVATLEYLQRGGRIGKAQALVGQLLSVRPILTIRDGELHPLTRVRGAKRVVPELVSQMRAALGPDPAGARVAIVHADAPEGAAELEAAVRASWPDARLEPVRPLGAVVGTHSGPGALGLGFTRAF
jgi:DegV family protein with EDD domain